MLQYLLVYGFRYRDCGASGEPVRANTPVDDEIGRICKGYPTWVYKIPENRKREGSNPYSLLHG